LWFVTRPEETIPELACIVFKIVGLFFYDDLCGCFESTAKTQTLLTKARDIKPALF
jgi:hypothetical protein